MRFVILALGLMMAGPGSAQSWQEPARGTPTRKALMDALRPHAMWLLGSPVEFVVDELRQSGNLAFAAVSPQRPGGGAIDLYETPGYQRGELDPDSMDGVSMQALYFKSGETWVAVEWSLGAQDVWFAYEPICAVWRKVIPEVCAGQ